MFLHLGNDVIVNENDIIGVFDIENTSISKHTRQFLIDFHKNGNTINVSYEMPKSFILCQKKDEVLIYISQISPATLRKRNGKNVKSTKKVGF